MEHFVLAYESVSFVLFDAGSLDISYRFIYVYLFLRVNCDKTMHAR